MWAMMSCRYGHILSDRERSEKAEGCRGGAWWVREEEGRRWAGRPRCPGHKHDTSSFDKPENAARNLHPDQVLEETTRIKVGPDQKYLHASYYWDGQAILAQTPVPASLQDFHQMVWEQGVSTAVVASPFWEGGRRKVWPWWPRRQNAEREVPAGELPEDWPVEVRTEGFQLTLDCRRARVGGIDDDVALYIVKMRRPGRRRYLAVLHLQSLPSGDTPDSLSSLAKLMVLAEQANAYMAQLNGFGAVPLLVHCSSGTGRTGALGLARGLLLALGRGGEVRPMGMLRELRRDRALAVRAPAHFLQVDASVLELTGRTLALTPAHRALLADSQQPPYAHPAPRPAPLKVSSLSYHPTPSSSNQSKPTHGLSSQLLSQYLSSEYHRNKT